MLTAFEYSAERWDSSFDVRLAEDDKHGAAFFQSAVPPYSGYHNPTGNLNVILVWPASKSGSTAPSRTSRRIGSRLLPDFDRIHMPLALEVPREDHPLLIRGD